jgi:hypothetical protein
MKKLIRRGIIYSLIVLCSSLLGIFIIGKTNVKLEDYVPNIVTTIFQTIVLGVVISYIGLASSYKKKIAFFNSIKAILAEPLKRFNEPKTSPVDLDNDNLGKTIDLAKKNIGKVGLDNYYELINILLSQRNAINGLLAIALQISELHAWMINGLICVHTRLIDEIKKIYENNGITHYNQIKETVSFKFGFNSVFEIYLDDCEQFINAKKSIKP